MDYPLASLPVMNILQERCPLEVSVLEINLAFSMNDVLLNRHRAVYSC